MFRDKLKKLFNKTEEGEQVGNDKRKIENLVFFIVVLIITIVIINVIWNGNDNKQNKQLTNDTSKQLATTNSNQNVSTSQNEAESTEVLEKKLEDILSKIQGVGEVSVCINYSESSEVVAMYNENSKTSTTEENDDSGGRRKIEETDTQKDVIYQENDGTKTPITAKIVKPKIEGAIITAQGVNDANVKNNIIQAVEAVTGLATHKIQVFEMSS